jgi:hypothetical protein
MVPGKEVIGLDARTFRALTVTFMAAALLVSVAQLILR